MKVAASMSVGRLAPKHSLDIDGIRAISPNVTPSLIKDDVVLCRGIVDPFGQADGTAVWTVSTGYEAESTDAGLVYIHYGSRCFDPPLQIPVPDLEWQELMGW